MIHRRTHPTPVDGCYGCKLVAVQVAPSAMPSRHAHAARAAQTEREWGRDMAAYKRLRDDGLQPPGIDGSARLEATASEPHEVATGTVWNNEPRKAERIRLGEEISKWS